MDSGGKCQIVGTDGAQMSTFSERQARWQLISMIFFGGVLRKIFGRCIRGEPRLLLSDTLLIATIVFRTDECTSFLVAPDDHGEEAGTSKVTAQDPWSLYRPPCLPAAADHGRIGKSGAGL